MEIHRLPALEWSRRNGIAKSLFVLSNDACTRKMHEAAVATEVSDDSVEEEEKEMTPVLHRAPRRKIKEDFIAAAASMDVERNPAEKRNGQALEQQPDSKTLVVASGSFEATKTNC